MNRTLPGLLLLVFTLMPLLLWSQVNIPLGSWRSHFSYRTATSLAVTADRVYAASANSLYYYDREENSIEILTALQGLSDAGISSLNYREEKDILVIAYRNGNIDLLQGGRVYNIRTIIDANLPGRRRIHDILFNGNLAFMATDYGISVLNLQSKDLQESYFNLGPGGQAAEVYRVAIRNDSIFAATSQGLISNAVRGANLSDFNSWRRHRQEELPVSGEISALAADAHGLYAGIGGWGLLRRRQNGGWEETSFKTEKNFRSIKEVPDGLLIALEDALYFYNTANGSVEQLSSPIIDSPNAAAIDRNGHIWVADARNGLLSDFEGAFKAYVPQGPLADVAEALYSDNERVIAVFNQREDAAGQPGAAGGFSVFSGGRWINYTHDDVPAMPVISGFSDVVYVPSNRRYYLSSLTGGLLEWDPVTDNFRRFTAGMEGVSLLPAASGLSPVSQLAADAEGQVWMVQPGTNIPLHRYNPATDTWEGYLENNSRAGGAVELLIMPGNDKWLQLGGEQGILVFNEESGKSRYFTGQNSGGVLLDRSVKSMALDLQGQLWVGLGQGINYFPNPDAALNVTDVNVVFPVYERRHLLNAEQVNSLVVDGGNRKWMGTTNGLWVAGDYGDTIYHHFTAANSPLPDNHILSQAILQQSGEVFIATPSGIVSYRSGATAAGFQHAAAIKVFPNPVYPGYSGMVGITGLASDVIIKITDVSGRLVKELTSEGGTASWDLTDTQGRRPATGVYLIFSATSDGVETLAGKMAIVN